jgi:hypothetical protein
MSASDGSSEEASWPFAADIPSAEFLTDTLAGCTGAALFVAPKEKPLDPPEAAPVLVPTATVGTLKLLGRDLAVVSCSSLPDRHKAKYCACFSHCACQLLLMKPSAIRL